MVAIGADKGLYIDLKHILEQNNRTFHLPYSKLIFLALKGLTQKIFILIFCAQKIVSKKKGTLVKSF
jgi:hypothetical protein